MFKYLILALVGSNTSACCNIPYYYYCYSKTEFPSTCSKKLGSRQRELWLCCCSSDTTAASTMTIRDLCARVMSRTTGSPTQQRPAVLNGNPAAQSREAAICHPCNTVKGLQQSPGHTRVFGANNQISSVLSASQLFLHAVFTQSKAICLSFSAPTSITHFPILHLFSQTIGQDLTSTETCSASLELAEHPTACVGMKRQPPDSLEASIPGACTAPLQCSSLGKLQAQRCPSFSRTAAYAQHVFKILACSQGTGIASTC